MDEEDVNRKSVQEIVLNAFICLSEITVSDTKMRKVK